MSYTGIEKEVFRKTIRELTFTPFIKLPVIYESSSENKLGRKEYDGITDNSEYVNERKRHERLLETLLKNKDTKKVPISQLITMPKVYDDILKQKRIHLYNYVAERLDFPSIDIHSPSVESLTQIAIIDSSHPNYETIIEYYPQYCTDTRNGVDFIEYILLLNISLTTQSRTLTMLQKLLNNPQNDNQINEWIDRVTKSIHSPSVYTSLVDTFFSNFLYITAKKYNEAIIILREDYGNPESRNADIDYYAYVETNAIMPNIVELHNKVIPTAWRLINCNNEYNPDRQKALWELESTDKDIKLKAEKYVVEVKAYIDKAIKSAEEILPTLFNK